VLYSDMSASAGDPEYVPDTLESTEAEAEAATKAKGVGMLTRTARFS